MKKSGIIIVALASTLWFGCKENIPAGLNLNPTSIAKDTSYITSTIPTPQPKNVLIEEFTGVTCSNCPLATVQIKQLQIQYSPRLVVVKVHNNLQATPKPNDPDFRNDDANALFSAFGASSKPSAGIDRLPNSTTTEYWHAIAALNGKIISQLAKPTPINIDLTSNLNTAKDSITVTSNITFTSASNSKYKYHLYILENDVEATQDSFDVVALKTFEIEGYKHEEILRKSITPVFVGDALPDSTQVPGRVYRKITQFAKPAKMINIDNGEVIFFITDATTKEIIHCQRRKL